MKMFSEWALHLAPTIILLMLVIFAMLGSKSWVIQGFMRVLAASNMMTGFFSHITKAVSFVTGGG